MPLPIVRDRGGIALSQSLPGKKIYECNYYKRLHDCVKQTLW